MKKRKNPNHREIIKNMVLSRKHNAIIALLKYLKKMTNKIIPLLILKVGSMQMQIPHRSKIFVEERLELGLLFF